MSRWILTVIALCALQANAWAQLDDLQADLKSALNRVDTASLMTVTQQYRFYRDSSDSQAFDSGYCTLTKHDRVSHYVFGGVEAFSDGEYLIRLSRPSKFMVVSRDRRSAGQALDMFPAETLTGFATIKRELRGEVAHWRLCGASRGVRSLTLVLDTREGHMRSVNAELLRDHPLLSGLTAGRSRRTGTVFVNITYTYSDSVVANQPQRSDFISQDADAIRPADSFSEFQLKLIE